MNELVFRLYSLAHITIKRIFGRRVPSALKLIGPSIGRNEDLDSLYAWEKFIESSVIHCGSPFDGFHYAGFILDKNEWCLDSWIWTNAAIVRLYVENNNINNAIELADKLFDRQQECGGWIVRNDYDSKGAIPMLAPNDSAYIANNAMLSVYKYTSERKYLDSACKCADWIMRTCRDDSMVYTGYNVRDGVWDKNNIIVDVGFTAGLFANLYEITKDEQYKLYLIRFCNRYIQLFYLFDKKGFATSINRNNQPQGGVFSRGQAWALEGLIPAYKVTRDLTIKEIIQNTIDTLIVSQNKDGSWPYNLTRKLMGNDCKGVAVIAKSIMQWYSMTNDNRLIIVAENALDWCRKHTVADGEAEGGIFSFCAEGAVVKDLYTSCAFVYASVYAIELEKMIREWDLKK